MEMFTQNETAMVMSVRNTDKHNRGSDVKCFLEVGFTDQMGFVNGWLRNR
jgi:hypothetical protein